MDIELDAGEVALIDQHRARAYSEGWWGSLTILDETKDGCTLETSQSVVHRLTIKGQDYYRVGTYDDDERRVFSVLIPVEAVDEANEPDGD